MAKLPKFKLSKDKDRDDWALRADKSSQVAKRFPTKVEGRTVDLWPPSRQTCSSPLPPGVFA